MAIDHDLSEGKCPFTGVRRHNAGSGPTNADWWPNQLNIKVLRQNSPQSDPMGKEFSYAEEFKNLDLNAVIKDLHALMTDSQDCGRPTMATMVRCSFGWRGTAQVHTASPTAAVAPELASSVSHRSVAGQTTRTSTRRTGSSGR
jgi:catalase (peroxidase I)